MKAVRENKNPEKTIELEFNQNTEGRNHKMMMLKTKNPFDAKFEYSALMYTVGNDKWIKTTILPVPPKFSGYETWNNIIITPVLSDWKFTN